MLVLSRKIGEKLVISDKITLVVNRISGNRVLLGIDAPDDVHVVRGELLAFCDEFPANSVGGEFERCASPR